MSKNIIAIVTAPIIWGLIMFPGNMLVAQFFPGVAAGEFTNGYLFTALIASFIYSLVTGALAARIAAADFARIGLYAGAAVLLVGVIMQVSAWDLLPQWYHLIFLFWLIPMCMLGAKVARPNAVS